MNYTGKGKRQGCLYRYCRSSVIK